MRRAFKKINIIVLVLVFGITALMPYNAFADLDIDLALKNHKTEKPEAEEPETEDIDDIEYTDDEIIPEEEFVRKDISWYDYENKKKTYHLRNESQLIGFASLVNERQTEIYKPERYEDFEGVTVILDADVKLTEKWIPVGNDEAVAFRGTFDGNNHTIRGFNIDTSGDYAGFFGYLPGTVKNLNLTGSVKTTGGRCGALAGYVAEEGEINKCTAHVKVSASAETGGICGYNDGTVRNSVNYEKVKGDVKVGGICGENWGRIIKCGNRGEIVSKNRGYATYGTGGVAGRSLSERALIDRCYNTGTIISRTEGTGGITGFANVSGSKILSCYNVGKINVKNDGILIGKVTGYAGGIAGIIPSGSVKIKSCYSACEINNTDVSGGIIGKYNVSSGKKDENIKNCHFMVPGVKYSVGADSSETAFNLPEGKKIAVGTLVNGATVLGPSYMNDNHGEYGSNGYPVLTWQEILDEEDLQSLSHISPEVQKRFNDFIDSQKKHRIGYSVYILFNYNEFAANALRGYNEKKHLQLFK